MIRTVNAVAATRVYISAAENALSGATVAAAILRGAAAGCGEKALILDVRAVHAGWPFYFARDYESAIRRFRKAVELDEHFIPAHGWLGMALAQQHPPTD